MDLLHAHGAMVCQSTVEHVPHPALFHFSVLDHLCLVTFDAVVLYCYFTLCSSVGRPHQQGSIPGDTHVSNVCTHDCMLFRIKASAEWHIYYTLYCYALCFAWLILSVFGSIGFTNCPNCPYWLTLNTNTYFHKAYSKMCQKHSHFWTGFVSPCTCQKQSHFSTVVHWGVLLSLR